MKKYLVLSGILFLHLFIIGQAQDLSPKLDELIASYAKIEKFNGAALVAKDGKIMLEKGIGIKNEAQNTLLDEHSIFQIGSVTKQFTAVAILKLSELGLLSLDDKLSKYYPDFPKGDSITIKNLLTHTSGIFNYTNDADFMATEAVKPATEEKILAIFKDKPLNFSPGSGWDYSNSGYSLLGYIIEKASKMKYEDVVRKYIFNPLHMNHSGFDFTHLTSPDKATGYYSPANEAPIVDSTVAFSAGAVYTTLGDLYLWHEGLQDGKLIGSKLLEEAYTPVKNNYGYGMGIDSIFGKRKISHGGGIFGFSSNFVRIPEDDVCIIFFSNRGESLGPMTNNILNILYDKPYELPVERKSIILAEDVLKRNEGVFDIPNVFSIKVTVRDGKLYGQPTGQEESQLLAKTESVFFIKQIDNLEIEFVQGSDGMASKLIVHQNGRDMVGERHKD